LVQAALTFQCVNVSHVTIFLVLRMCKQISFATFP